MYSVCKNVFIDKHKYEKKLVKLKLYEVCIRTCHRSGKYTIHSTEFTAYKICLCAKYMCFQNVLRNKIYSSCWSISQNTPCIYQSFIIITLLTFAFCDDDVVILIYCIFILLHKLLLYYLHNCQYINNWFTLSGKPW